MKIAIVGLGYVGSVTGVCLAGAGHDVTFVEVHPVKVAAEHRREPCRREGLSELIRECHKQGRLHATHDLMAALAEASRSLCASAHRACVRATFS
jgi:UDP-glucose 6-dehydrogenase